MFSNRKKEVLTNQKKSGFVICKKKKVQFLRTTSGLTTTCIACYCRRSSRVCCVLREAYFKTIRFSTILWNVKKFYFSDKFSLNVISDTIATRCIGCTFRYAPTVDTAGLVICAKPNCVACCSFLPLVSGNFVLRLFARLRGLADMIFQAKGIFTLCTLYFCSFYEKKTWMKNKWTVYLGKVIT